MFLCNVCQCWLIFTQSIGLTVLTVVNWATNPQIFHLLQHPDLNLFNSSNRTLWLVFIVSCFLILNQNHNARGHLKCWTVQKGRMWKQCERSTGIEAFARCLNYANIWWKSLDTWLNIYRLLVTFCSTSGFPVSFPQHGATVQLPSGQVRTGSVGCGISDDRKGRTFYDCLSLFR